MFKFSGPYDSRPDIHESEMQDRYVTMKMSLPIFSLYKWVAYAVTQIWILLLPIINQQSWQSFINYFAHRSIGDRFSTFSSSSGPWSHRLFYHSSRPTYRIPKSPSSFLRRVTKICFLSAFKSQKHHNIIRRSSSEEALKLQLLISRYWTPPLSSLHLIS